MESAKLSFAGQPRAAVPTRAGAEALSAMGQDRLARLTARSQKQVASSHQLILRRIGWRSLRVGLVGIGARTGHDCGWGLDHALGWVRFLVRNRLWRWRRRC